jgi:hypothetical protein
LIAWLDMGVVISWGATTWASLQLEVMYENNMYCIALSTYLQVIVSPWALHP